MEELVGPACAEDEDIDWFWGRVGGLGHGEGWRGWGGGAGRMVGKWGFGKGLRADFVLWCRFFVDGRECMGSG